MKLLPLSLNLNGQRALVVGGGPVGFRRCKTLVDAGLQVQVVSIDVLPAFVQFIQDQKLNLAKRAVTKSDVSADYALVVAATNDRAANQMLAAQAKQHGVLVNVADDAAACDVTFPSVLERSPVQVAVSSGSASPILSKMLMRRLSTVIPSGYGKLADLVGAYRQKVKQAIPKSADRKLFWEKILTGVVAENIFSGRPERAETLLQAALAKPKELQARGEVYLIGAGPGDPDLLTVRAVRLLHQAQVIVYDRLVSPEILSMFGEHQEMLYVGKQRANHSMPQQNINQVLVDLAKQGKRVARLKGGDPFIFGRGGEEIETLAQSGIPFQVIPGITAAAGCASYSGIPLTHRDYAQSVRFVTGQLQDNTVDLNWPQLIDNDQTLVFYMGLNGFPIISQNLIEHGMNAAMPVALIEKGTTLQQRVHITSLDSIGDYLATNKVQSPSLFIVGEVVQLHQKLSWFEANEAESK